MKISNYFIVWLMIWALISICPGTLWAMPHNRIVKTDISTSTEMETIKIQTTQQPEYRIIEQKNHNRIVIYINGVFLPEAYDSEKENSHRIDRFRISHSANKQTRLVLDLDENTDYKTEVVTLKNGRYTLNINLFVLPATVGESFAGKKKSTLPVQKNSFEKIPSTPIKDGDSPQPVAAQIQEQKNDSKDLSEEKTVVRLDSSTVDKSIFDAEEPVNIEKKTWDFSGLILVRTAVDSSNDQANEQEVSFKNRTLLSATYDNMFKLSVLSDYLFYGTSNQTDGYTLDLFEVYYKHQSSNFDMTVGKQIKRWGKTDQVSPVDILNPENLTEFIIPSYEERKIPVWMADLVFKKDSFFFEGVFIPFFEPSKFEYFGTDWAYFSHLKKNIGDSGLNPALISYFNDIQVDEDKPGKDVEGFEYAARMGGTVNGVDLAVIYHYGYEDIPNFQSFPVKNLSLENPNSLDALLASIGSLTLTNEQVETKYLKTHMAGFEFETIFGDFGLRGEAAYHENESLLTQSFTSVRCPTFFWVAGADYTSLNHWYFNLQVGHQHIFDYDPSILFFEQDNYSLIGTIKKDIILSKLTGSVQYTYMLSDNSYYLSPRITYTAVDNLEAVLGMNIFKGNDDSIFGRYDRNDQIFIDLSYQF